MITSKEEKMSDFIDITELMLELEVKAVMILVLSDSVF